MRYNGGRLSADNEPTRGAYYGGRPGVTAIPMESFVTSDEEASVGGPRVEAGRYPNQLGSVEEDADMYERRTAEEDRRR